MSKPNKDKEPKYDPKKKFSWGEDDKITITKAPKKSTEKKADRDLRNDLIRIAYEQPHIREALMPLLRVAAEVKDVPYSVFWQFWTEKYDMGRRMVPNPNRASKEQFPEVTADTARKNKTWSAKMHDECRAWAASREKKESPAQKTPTEDNTPKEKPATPKPAPEPDKAARQLSSSNDFEEYASEWKKVYQNLDPDHLDGIKKYSGHGYKAVNDQLRQGDLSGAQKETVRQLSAFFASPKARLKEKVICYRGLQGGPIAESFYQESLSVGDTVSDKAYNSSSLDHEYAKGEFAFGGVIMVITAPKGARAAYLEPITSTSDEKELLIDRNARYRVDKIIKKHRETNEIHCTLIQD